ncbi:MAG: WD40/YVTN/BNR-like repeat-containing protein [bacterium]
MADFKFKDITGEAVVLSLFMKQSSLAFSPGGQIFIGTYGSGLFESKDKGATWIQLKGGWKTTDINSIAVNSTGSLYLCTNEGVFRSADSGTSWTNIGLSEYRVLAVAVSPNGKIFASTESESGPTGIWKTLEQN